MWLDPAITAFQELLKSSLRWSFKISYGDHVFGKSSSPVRSFWPFWFSWWLEWESSRGTLLYSIIRRSSLLSIGSGAQWPLNKCHLTRFVFYICVCVCVCVCARAQSLRSCPTLRDPMDCSPPGPSVMGFFRQEEWSGLLFPPPGDLPDPGIEPVSPSSPVLQVDSFTAESPGKLFYIYLAPKWFLGSLWSISRRPVHRTRPVHFYWSPTKWGKVLRLSFIISCRLPLLWCFCPAY